MRIGAERGDRAIGCSRCARVLARRTAATARCALHLVIPGESETVLALPSRRGVDPSEALLRAVDGLFGRPVADRGCEAMTIRAAA